MDDKYCDFEELQKGEPEGVYKIVIKPQANSNVAIIAPHGGKIEPYTCEIAKKISGDIYNLYCFEGVKQRHNLRDLHITSTNFDEPKCLDLESPIGDQ